MYGDMGSIGRIAVQSTGVGHAFKLSLLLEVLNVPPGI